MLVDLKQDTTESQRLVSNVFSQQWLKDEQNKRRQFGDMYHSICASEAVNMAGDNSYNYYQPPRNYFQPIDHYWLSFRPEEMYSVAQGVLDQIYTLLSCSECEGYFQRYIILSSIDVDNESLEKDDADESDTDLEESNESEFNKFINKIFEENDDKFQ